MNNREAIKELECAKTKLKEANIFISPSMDIAINMAKEALQFQDIMVNNPKSAKPTPEVCKNCTGNDRLHKSASDDLIIKGAKGIQDGLYNIQNGELFQYKAKGGTVRTYPIVEALEEIKNK